MGEARTPADVRALLPALRHRVWLNAAATTPLPEPVERVLVETAHQSAEAGDLGFERHLARIQEVRGRFARFIGAEPNECAFVGSTSWGFHFVARILAQRGVREIVTLESEFPSSVIPFLHEGFAVRAVRRRPDGTYAPEDVAAAVGPETGAIVVSAVQYASGFRIDLGEVARICRDRGLAFAVNASQALGQLPIDVRALGADFLCATSHKWLMGGHGVGLFYARAAALEGVRLPVASWTSTANPMAMDPFPGSAIEAKEGQPWFTARGAVVRKDVSALEIGPMNFAPIFGVGEALAILESVGLEVIEEHNRGLQAMLRAGLRARGFEPNVPDEPSRVAGICVFPVEGDPLAAVRALVAQGVVVTPRGGGVRVATHVYNTEEDVARLLAALENRGQATFRPRAK